jgi:hypothetical protein
MRQLGIVNVADALTQLVPQNISTYTPFLTGDDQASGLGIGGGGMETLDRGSFFIGSTIANLRGLDPTFGTRTLTLVNGRRMVSSSNQADVVDLNIIPSNLLQRMDVVTGGASATYGSGAMAGVVNLVLDNRLTGVNIDADYGVNEAGDGGNPHVSISCGTPLFGGKAHVLLGAEWRDQAAIRDCAAARDWCADSRAMFNNYSGFAQNVRAVNTPLPGYEQLPARFEMANVRYSQFAPAGTIYFNNTNVTTNHRLTADGTGVEEYALGFRGGNGSNSINGDGPLVTTGTTLRPSNETRSLFTNFEYDFTDTTTAYVQGNYAKTDSLNKNRYTSGNYCVRYDAAGVAAGPADLLPRTKPSSTARAPRRPSTTTPVSRSPPRRAPLCSRTRTSARLSTTGSTESPRASGRPDPLRRTGCRSPRPMGPRMAFHRPARQRRFPLATPRTFSTSTSGPGARRGSSTGCCTASGSQLISRIPARPQRCLPWAAMPTLFSTI